MKIALIGGGSPSTPALIAYLAECRKLPETEIVLLSRSETSLGAVARAARALTVDHPMAIAPISLADSCWPEALVGADIVLLQTRIGGYAAREYDETFPLAFDICGDQDLGPGGLANAWRSWPHLKRFFLEAAKWSPNTTFIVLSSPVGLLVRLGLLSAPNLRIVGICELPWATLLNICSTVDAPCRRVQFSYVGLHHFGWFFRLRCGNRNIIREFAAAIQESSEFPSAALVRRFSAIPTPYARLHFENKKVVAEQKRNPGSRSRYLAEYRREALDVFNRGRADEIKAVLKRRPTPWYSKAVGPLMAALAGARVTQPFFLSCPNGGAVQQLAHQDVLELAYCAREGAIDPFPVSAPIPNRVFAAMRQFLEAESLAAEAVARQDPLMLSAAIAAHPWTSRRPGAVAAITEMVMAAAWGDKS